MDLNLQFPANWEKARKIKYNEGFRSFAPRDFIGNKPICEPESKALYNFTIKNDFKFTISFHSQGKVIYWKYLNYLPQNSLEIARKFAKVSKYELDETPLRSSFAGYRDWFIQKFNKPSFTVEIGEGENPLPICQFDEIYNDVLGILVLGMTV